MLLFIGGASSALWRGIKKNLENKDEMKYVAVCSEDMIADYERLRNDVLDATCIQATAPGRALFLRQGMAAWMRAWTACPKRSMSETDSAPRFSPPLSQGLLAQVTMILAGMLLGQYKECTT